MKDLLKFLVKKEFYIIVFAFPSLIVGWLGLSRPYFSSPDQDLLWVSQSIRLFKGLGPSYSDHPGAFWPISYLVKFFILSRSLVSDYIDQQGAVSVEIIDKLIHISRIENTLITASLTLMFFLILKQLEIDKKTTILTTYTLCLSSATLSLVSNIRHENIGIFFMFLYILLTIKDFNKSKNLYFHNYGAIINSLFFYASIFCKQQILLLSPLIFSLILYVFKIKDPEYYEKLENFIKSEKITNLLFCFFLLGVPWIIISVEEFNRFGPIYLVNLPFWSFINTGLVLTMIISAKERIRKSTFLKYFFLLTPIQILIFEIFAPNVWRRSVTAFPSLLFKFTSLYDGNINLLIRFKDFINYTKKYSTSLSWPNNLVFLIILLLTIYFFTRLLKIFTHKRDFSLLDFSFFNILILTAIISLRQHTFYQIYFFIPILILLSIGCSKNFSKKNNFEENSFINNFLFLSISILLISFSIKSTTNIFNLNKFVSSSQSQDLLCAPQTLEYSLRNTPAGTCDRFEAESDKKNEFDSWW